MNKLLFSMVSKHCGLLTVLFSSFQCDECFLDNAFQMPSTIEELDAAIQDTICQANSILCLNPNALEQYETRQRKVSPAVFCDLILLSFASVSSDSISLLYADRFPFKETWNGWKGIKLSFKWN